MKKKRLFSVLAIIVMVTAPLVGCTKTSTPVLSYEDGIKSGCFDAGGFIGPEGCVPQDPVIETVEVPVVVENEKLVTVEVPVVVYETVEVEKIVEVVVTPTPVPSNPALPVMEWSSDVGGEDHTYKAHITPTHYEWWMDPYRFEETGTGILDIGSFSKFSYNSVAGKIEILDSNKEVIKILPNGNFFLRDEWFPVEEGFKYISFLFEDGTNPSNGALTVAIP